MDLNNLRKRLEQVIIADATDIKVSDFLATHVPFKNLKYVNSGVLVDNPNYISEESFLKEHLLENRDDHSLFVVQGDSGSGKSHFIRWLKLRYDTEIDKTKEVSILIKRSQNTLQGAIRQIVEANEFNDIMKQNEIKKLIEANQNLSSEKLNFTINYAFVTEIQSEDNEQAELEPRNRKLLASFLSDPVVQEQLLFKENGPIERIKSKLASDDKKSMQQETDARFFTSDFDFSFSSPLVKNLNNGENMAARHTIKCAEKLMENERNFKEKVVKYLNTKIDIVIQSCLRLSDQDFRQIFENLRKELRRQGKSLTLFIEDITSFTGIDKALVEALIVDHRSNEELCRISSLIGVTSAYYKGNFPDNMKARVTGRVIIENTSIFTKDEDKLEIAARYLNAINLESKELEAWQNAGADDRNLPIATNNLKYKWSIFRDEAEREFSVFPFNKNALVNMYATLKEQTPRAFLKEVVKRVLIIYIKDPINFPPSEKELEGYFKIPNWRERLHEQAVMIQAGETGERLSCFIRVWGDKTAYRTSVNGIEFLGGVERSVYNLFNLPFIDGVEGDNNIHETELENTNDDTTTTVISKKINDSFSKDIFSKTSLNSSRTNNVPQGFSTEEQLGDELIDNKKLKEFNEYEEELKDWFYSNGPLKKHIRLRDDICEFLKTSIDWDSENISSLLVNAGLSKKMVSIEGQNAEITRGLFIEKNEKSYYALLAISAWRCLGDKSWGFPNSLGYLSNITNWLLSVKESVISSIKAPKEMEEERWNMFQWGLIGDYYVNVLSGNIAKGDTDQSIYYKLIQKKSVLELKNLDMWNKLNENLIKKADEVKENHEFVIRYFNCKQGEASPDTTPVFYLDAYEILNAIHMFRVDNWDIEKLDMPNIESASVLKWYITYNFITKYILSSLNRIVDDENIKITKLFEDIQKYTGSYNEEELKLLFTKMNSFLTKTLENIRESYGDEFNDFINKKLDPAKLINLYNRYSASQKEPLNHKLIYYSSTPINKVKMYFYLFSSMDKLLDSKYNKYKKAYNSLKDSVIGTEEVKSEIVKDLNNIKESLLSVSGGDDYVIK